MNPVKILAVQYLSAATEDLCKALGAPKGYPCLGLITTDCDDATYIALDEATKSAEVQVCFGSSFYAGAGNASTPYAGEVLGILCATTPGAVRSGMEAALSALERIGLETGGRGVFRYPPSSQSARYGDPCRDRFHRGYCPGL